MTDSILLLGILCIMVFLAGFVDAVGGGGGLISLPGYLIYGMSPHSAIATNKLSSAVGTAVSTIKYIKNGYIKRPKLAFFCAVSALVGAPIGSLIALRISNDIMGKVLLVIIPLTAVYVLKKPQIGKLNGKPFSNNITILIGMAISFVIGLYDGFYGPGCGTFLILLLTSVARLELNEAAGTTKIINLTSNVASLVTYLLSGQVVVVVGLIAGIFSIGGHYVGSRCFSKNGAKIIKPIILVVLVIMAVKIVVEIIN